MSAIRSVIIKQFTVMIRLILEPTTAKEAEDVQWQLALSLPIYGRQRKPSAGAIQRRLAL